MQTRILTNLDQTTYNSFLQNHPQADLHQTWQWGEFQAQIPGRGKFWVVVVENKNNEIIASALVILQTFPFKKSWLFCPRGPLLSEHHPEATTLLFQKIQEIAHTEQSVFLRLEPPKNFTLPLNANPKFRPAHAHHQPENTLFLDLNLTEPDLLKQMKPKGRYNIKVAQKHGVSICIAENTPEDFAKFQDLLAQTSTRDHFGVHNISYYQKLINTLGATQAKLYFAELPSSENSSPSTTLSQQSKHSSSSLCLAAALVVYFKDTAIYYFGASSNQHRNTMAPYLLHWKIIQDAKKQGYKTYDFFGIAPENEPNHPWSSVTEFKLKFGGQRFDYPKAIELVYKPLWYVLVKLAKKLRN